jgi:hypothetical protein
MSLTFFAVASTPENLRPSAISSPILCVSPVLVAYTISALAMLFSLSSYSLVNSLVGTVRSITGGVDKFAFLLTGRALVWWRIRFQRVTTVAASPTSHKITSFIMKIRKKSNILLFTNFQDCLCKIQVMPSNGHVNYSIPWQ